MEIIRDPKVFQEKILELKRSGKKIGFVPTMGALHEGHLSLVDIAKKHSDVVMMSIYLNPKQFAPSEDLKNYPSNFKKDTEAAQARGVDLVFAPTDEYMYPKGFQTSVDIKEITKGLCGAARPGHFTGVTTVVLKLFNIVQPDVAVFGEKDYQQLKVIERMVRDLLIPVKIVAAPITRENDGLAMSSRNAYLSHDERMAALSINQALRMAKEMVAKGERSPHQVASAVRTHIQSSGRARVDYVKVVDPETLEEATNLKQPARLLVAAFFGRARLIDNCLLG